MVVSKESDAQLVDYSMLFSVTDYKFYAVYIEVNVHDSVTSLDLLDWYDETYTDAADPGRYNISGVVVSPKSSSIAGKITLPRSINNKPVIGVTGFSGSNVTAIFWEGGDNPELRMVRTSAFQNTPLKFFEFTSGLRTIAQSAFYTQRNAIADERCIALLGEAPLLKIDADAFNSAFGFRNIAEFKLRGTVQEIAAHAFLFGQNGNNVISVLKIGTPDEPSELRMCGSADYAGIRPSDTSYSSFITKATIYKKSGVFNDAIVDQSAPHIYGVGSWDVQSI